MSSWTIICVIVLSCVILLDVGKRRLTKVRYGSSRPLPPGPPGLPFIGNVIGIDTNAPWLTYTKWAKSYGDLVYTRLLGKDIIIINSETAAKELLESRSWNYSDRPQLITSDLCGVGFITALLPYGDRWRLHRRFFHQTFRREAAPRFLHLQHRKACQLLRRLLEAPDHLSEHVFEYTASIILNSIYDYDATSRQDELVDIVSKVIDIVQATVNPKTAVIVGAFPALLKLPSWLPGMSFKNKMATAREFAKKYVEEPFAHSTQRMTSGSHAPSMVYDALRRVVDKGDLADETWVAELKGAAASCIRHDRPSLPYVDAILRETVRSNPIAPLSIPHAVVDDDIYDGFHIPKGAMVLPNIWSMAHDESKYPNPHDFTPERFLNDDGTLKPYTTEHLAFGFGRRICVGRYFADTSVWSVISKFLAVYTILKPLDETGAEISVEPKFSSGSVVQPLPFGFRIVPRNPGMDAQKLEALIAASTA